MKDEAERRVWLVEQLAIETRRYADGAGAPGEFGKLAEYALARGNIILDIGEAFELISGKEKGSLHHALFAKDADAILALLPQKPSE